jgi:hypothetical protein
MPSLIDAYKKAIISKLVNEEISADILPLLSLNSTNLLKTINQLHDILKTNNILQD